MPLSPQAGTGVARHSADARCEPRPAPARRAAARWPPRCERTRAGGAHRQATAAGEQGKQLRGQQKSARRGATPSARNGRERASAARRPNSDAGAAARSAARGRAPPGGALVQCSRRDGHKYRCPAQQLLRRAAACGAEHCSCAQPRTTPHARSAAAAAEAAAGAGAAAQAPRQRRRRRKPAASTCRRLRSRPRQRSLPLVPPARRHASCALCRSIVEHRAGASASALRARAAAAAACVQDTPRAQRQRGHAARGVTARRGARGRLRWRRRCPPQPLREVTNEVRVDASRT